MNPSSAARCAGMVELLATEVTVLNTVSRPLPFPVSPSEEQEDAREEVRLRHRVLDLRWVLVGLHQHASACIISSS